MCLMQPIAEWEKFASSLASSGVDAFVEWETIPLADYLIRYLRDDDPDWRDLFIGERIKQLNMPTDSIDRHIERHDRVFSADRDSLCNLLRPELSDLELQPLITRFDAARELVTDGVRASKEVKVLFVGDCLLLELTTFLSVRLLKHGYTLRPIFVASKNPIELRSSIRGLANEPFDLIYYSPYSYEFSVLLAQTHYLKGMFNGRASLAKLAAATHRQVAPTIRLLQEQFNCTLFLQNTANIRRHNSSPASYLKNFATSLARKNAAKEVNELLTAEVAEINAHASRPIVLIDEMLLVAKHGELALGKKFYDSEPQHPTVLALRLAELFTATVVGVKRLSTKKVVVLDLDNTLWDGVIGEGAVTHLHRRQRVLQLLRQKGILLAIASKNDPRNVHWTDATLREDDFVASRINWEPKALNIKRIAEELNLKLKDFVFIDDRPDEREMVQLAIPDICCLDATTEFTWNMLDWWAEALPEQNEADRTQMYLERKVRQAHLDELAEHEGMHELLSSLGLRLEIRPASTRELPRAAELINRTNQFNTCGSRVTERQVSDWNAAPDFQILVAEAADKFGTMGIVSVMVLQQTGETVEIPIWVLSCRVFGFGIESAMLNQVRRIAKSLGATAIHGLVVETPNNQPCREVYSKERFTGAGQNWESTNLVPSADPEWLSVTIANAFSTVGAR